MAPRPFRRATGMWGAALPSLLTILVLLAGGVDAQSCDEAFTECEAHDLCTKCILAFDSEATCSEYAFDSFNTCDLRGVAYCCGAEATGDLDACLEDGYTIDYWQCILGQHGCSVTDMPCFLSDRSEEDAEAQDEDSGAARGAAAAPRAVAAAAVALALAFAGSFVGL